MILKRFDSRWAFYKFLKEKVGVFFREAEARSFEGVFYVVYLDDKTLNPDVVHRCAKDACLAIFYNEGRYALCGSEAKIRDFCSCIVKTHKDKAFEILRGLQEYRKNSFKLQYNYKILPLGIKTAIMGVLNVTPDSFSDGGEFLEPKKALERAIAMAQDGAEIIDIGGESTRPGAERVSAEEELSRVLPVLRMVRKELPNVWISIDTYKAQVAKACLDEGADIINDVSGGSFDKDMYKVLAKYNCPYIMTHIKGTPQTWKSMPIVYEDVVEEIMGWFRERIKLLREEGYKGDIILDAGIGFGKLPEHNVEIIKRIDEFKIFGLPIAIGVSRKSFIGLTLEGLLKKKTQPIERLFGSLGALSYAVVKGVHIVRVHDVRETREFLALLDTVRTYGEF